MENNVNAIIEGLNDEQKQAVSCTEGPVLIVAGAGSGKTRVLTSRIAYILSKGTDPERILALTFTKKAAQEMKDRIARMVGPHKARKLVMGTFHSVFIRFLRDYSQSLGYPKEFTIYDQSDSVSAIKACLKELGLESDKAYKPKDIQGRISMAKNNLVTAKAYRANPNAMISDSHAKRPRLAEVFALYEQKCRQSGVMDFDDILLNMNILLRDNPQACSEIAARFSYIMVDEYQDTNYAQYLIIRKLSQAHRNICVVGDDSQSIYAFRGARIENILNFKKDYNDCRVFRLERNYRSTQMIVNAANSVIAHNESRIPKKCYAVGEEGEKISILHSYDERGEAQNVVTEIYSRMRNDGAQYQDFAILYRTNSQSRALEEQLRNHSLPYVIYSGHAFYDRMEVKDTMAYFKLAINPNDDESFKRIVNKPARAIGETTLDALVNVARVAGTSLFKAVYSDAIAQSGMRPAVIEKLRIFCAMVNGWAMKAPQTDALEMAKTILDQSGLLAMFKQDTSIEGMSRVSNVEELVNSVAVFVEDRYDEIVEEQGPEAAEGVQVTLSQFLENTMLLSAVDMEDEEDANNKISLMTVHSAKGLEFPYVIVTGMEENLFPSGGQLALKDDIEEERRLFYVAVTRACKTVALSYSSERMRNGKRESNAPSRFLREIDEQYLSNPLSDEDFDVSGSSGFGGFGSKGFGGFGGASRYGGGYSEYGGSSARYAGSRTSEAPSRGPQYGNGSRYGSSGKVQFIKSKPGTLENKTLKSPTAGATLHPASYSYQKPPVSSEKPPIIDPNFVPTPMKELHEGDRVEHNRFGIGTILSMEGTFPELKAKVSFDHFGEKLLLLKYAKLRLMK